MITLLIKLASVLVVVLLLAAYLVLIERKLLGRFQLRYGPNRAGYHGLLQPLADGVKLLLKEDLIPAGADRFLFMYAPAIVATVPLLLLAVIPLGNTSVLTGAEIPTVIADLNVGVLYVLGLSSLGVYGVILGGWAANSKYSLLGGIRATAQMVSYELSLGLSLVPVVMLSRSFSLVDIVNSQARYPFILVQPVSFIIFIISAMAERKRLPFDLPEAENELMAGFHTEYSGMRFALFFLGALVAVFFLGGWRGPLLPPVIWLLLKILLVPFLLIWTRATLPRLRYDQLMRFGWQFLVPIALLNIVVSGGIILWMGS